MKRGGVPGVNRGQMAIWMRIARLQLNNVPLANIYYNFLTYLRLIRSDTCKLYVQK